MYMYYVSQKLFSRILISKIFFHQCVHSDPEEVFDCFFNLTFFNSAHNQWYIKQLSLRAFYWYIYVYVCVYAHQFLSNSFVDGILQDFYTFPSVCCCDHFILQIHPFWIHSFLSNIMHESSSVFDRSIGAKSLQYAFCWQRLPVKVPIVL